MMNHDSHNETNDATKEMNSVNVQNIPAALRENALWCVWRRSGNDKKPYNPISGKFAQSNNPNTFVDFATAYRAYTDFRYDGVGIGVFNNICAIDIDHGTKQEKRRT